MKKSFNKEKYVIVTMRNLADIVLGEEIVPTPNYNQKQEGTMIVQPRGTIFARLKKSKRTLRVTK